MAEISVRNKKFAESIIHKYLPNVVVRWVEPKRFIKLDARDEAVRPDIHTMYMDKGWLSISPNSSERNWFEVAIVSSIAAYEATKKFGKHWNFTKKGEELEGRREEQILKREKLSVFKSEYHK